MGKPIDRAWEQWLQVYWQTFPENCRKSARPSRQNADDVIMDKIISEKNEPADLQGDLSGVETWGAVNGMELNVS
jgi:hypothetical protein